MAIVFILSETYRNRVFIGIYTVTVFLYDITDIYDIVIYTFTAYGNQVIDKL